MKAHFSKQSLNTAKSQLSAWRAAQPPKPNSLERTGAQKQFDKIKSVDADFNQKMLLAARNGRAPTDNDKEGLIEDLADLQRLEDESTLE